MDSTADPGMVYVIDDDASMRRVLGALLAASGLEHQTYESADLFLRQYADRGPACILSDVRMPGLTGLQLLDRLHELAIHHPVILITAFGDMDTAVRCFRHGAADFFEKPVSGTLLLGRLQETIERDRGARQLDRIRRDTHTSAATLSPREQQVMEMLFDGMPNKAVAHELNLSEKTVAAHRSHILEKMHAPSLPELVRALTIARLESDRHYAAASAA